MKPEDDPHALLPSRFVYGSDLRAAIGHCDCRGGANVFDRPAVEHADQCHGPAGGAKDQGYVANVRAGEGELGDRLQRELAENVDWPAELAALTSEQRELLLDNVNELAIASFDSKVERFFDKPEDSAHNSLIGSSTRSSAGPWSWTG